MRPLKRGRPLRGFHLRKDRFHAPSGGFAASADALSQGSLPRVIGSFFSGAGERSRPEEGRTPLPHGDAPAPSRPRLSRCPAKRRHKPPAGIPDRHQNTGHPLCRAADALPLSRQSALPCCAEMKKAFPATGPAMTAGPAADGPGFPCRRPAPAPPRRPACASPQPQSSFPRIPASSPSLVPMSPVSHTARPLTVSGRRAASAFMQA